MLDVILWVRIIDVMIIYVQTDSAEDFIRNIDCLNHIETTPQLEIQP